MKHFKNIILAFFMLLVLFSSSMATVSSEDTPRVQYTANGITTNFPITFTYVSISDVHVYFISNSTGLATAWTKDASGPTGYTVSAGAIVANTAPSNGYLVAVCTTPVTQLVDVKPNRALTADTLEGVFDKLTLIGRDLKGSVSRALIYGPTYTGSIPYAEDLADEIKQDSVDASVAAVNALTFATSLHIDNLAALRLFPGGETTSIYLDCRTTNGDGGQGAFVWSTTDMSAEVTADPQSGIYVAPTSDPTGASGAWVRQYTKDMYIEWFGAKDGTDSTLAIQAAIDASFNVGNPLHAGPGIFLLSDALIMPRDATTGRPWRTLRFFGSGSHSETAYVTGGYTYGTTFKAAPGYNGELVYLKSNRHTEFHDILFIGAGKGVSGSIGVLFNNSSVDVSFYNAKFYGFEHCVKIGDVATVTPGNDDRTLFQDCAFEYATTGIRSEGAEAFSIKTNNCFFGTLLDYGFTAAAATSGNLLATGSMFMTLVSNIEISSNSRASVYVESSFFEGPGKIISADVVAGILPAITFIGNNFNSYGGLTDPLVLIRGNGSANFIGNTWESVQPLIHVEKSGGGIGLAVFQGNRWFGEPVFRKVSNNTYGDVIEIGERHLWVSGNYAKGATISATVLKVCGRDLSFDSIADYSAKHTKYAGSILFDDTPSVNVPGIRTVLTDGTTGTVSGVTGDIVAGSNELTVNDSSNLFPDARIVVAGALTSKIIDIDGPIVTLNNASPSTVSGAAVSFSPPTYKHLSPRGYRFTMAAAPTMTVNDAYIGSSSSRVMLTPANASAAVLQGGADALYVDTKVGGTSFVVRTASGSAATGSEIFDYVIVD